MNLTSTLKTLGFIVLCGFLLALIFNRSIWALLIGMMIGSFIVSVTRTLVVRKYLNEKVYLYNRK